MKIIFLNTDFGIGGAKRLMLDAAIALRNSGHHIHIVTIRLPEDLFSDFEPFKDNLSVIGDSLPSTLFGRCYWTCAYIRIYLAALYICMFHSDTDIVFCDQVPASLPLLSWFSSAKLLFYCHYPEQIDASNDNYYSTKMSLPNKWVHQYFLDPIRKWHFTAADTVLFNSRYTYESVFSCLGKTTFSGNMDILYPSLNQKRFAEFSEGLKLPEQKEKVYNELASINLDFAELIANNNNTCMFLSFNRIDPHLKDLKLAINGFAKMLLSMDERDRANCLLVMAGGLDPVFTECVEHYQELLDLVRSLKLEKQIKFVLNPSDQAKVWLMQHARLLLYTAHPEHFGIAPLEGMYLSTPVLAVNCAGPKETILDGVTGFLREPVPEAFAEVMLHAFNNAEEMKQMGKEGHNRVVQHFSFTAFSERLNEHIFDLKKRSLVS